jgi:hypothetical protein
LLKFLQPTFFSKSQSLLAPINGSIVLAILRKHQVLVVLEECIWLEVILAGSNLGLKSLLLGIGFDFPFDNIVVCECCYKLVLAKSFISNVLWLERNTPLITPFPVNDVRKLDNGIGLDTNDICNMLIPGYSTAFDIAIAENVQKEQAVGRIWISASASTSA